LLGAKVDFLRSGSDPFPGSHLVYIDADGVIYDAALNQTNSGQNNNKFYRIQLLHNAKTANYMTWTRWGRVGDRGQHALLGDGTLDSALSNFEKKFKDKSKLKWQDRFDPPKPKSYVFLEKDYEPDSDQDDNATPADPKTTAQSERPVDHVEPTSKLVQPLQDLMKLIFNQQFMSNAMTAMNYNANKMPLGKLSKRTLEQAFQTLKDLSAHIIDGVPGTSHQDVENLSNLYFSLIPHDFGRNRAPIISTEQLLRNETELLESLSDMKLADEIMKSAKKGASDGERESLHHYDRQFNSLGMTEMTPLKHSTKEFKMLAAYLKESKGATHAMSYEIEEIFRIERNGEEERFGSSDYAKLTKKNRRLLWHGSRATNFGGILSQGLRIAPPEAPVNGYMFGKGVYLADMSSKSAGYCCPHNSGGSALLLLCDAELGDPMLELTNAEYNAGDLAKKNGSLTTWGKGRTGPSKWKDASCVHKTLKGVKMVSLGCRFISTANMLIQHSLILLIPQEIPMWTARICCTMSTLYTTSARFDYDTCSVSRCRHSLSLLAFCVDLGFQRLASSARTRGKNKVQNEVVLKSGNISRLS